MQKEPKKSRQSPTALRVFAKPSPPQMSHRTFLLFTNLRDALPMPAYFVTTVARVVCPDPKLPSNISVLCLVFFKPLKTSCNITLV